MSARALVLALTFIGALLPGIGGARAESLVAALSTTRVDIHSTYTGAVLTVFGLVQRDGQSGSRAGPYDIVVTVRGPPRNFVVREKEQVGFAWLNTRQRRFTGAPSYLAILSSRPFDKVTTPLLRQRFGVGLDAVLTPPGLNLDDLPGERAFRDALIRKESAAGRFVSDPAGVKLLTPDLFSAAVALPATAPIGTYHVSVALYADGAQLTTTQTYFEVGKTGAEQSLAAAARDSSFVYGLAAIVLALLFGWLASIVFRRD